MLARCLGGRWRRKMIPCCAAGHLLQRTIRWQADGARYSTRVAASQGLEVSRSHAVLLRQRVAAGRLSLIKSLSTVDSMMHVYQVQGALGAWAAHDLAGTGS